jgi:hypothetical protein
VLSFFCPISLRIYPRHRRFQPFWPALSYVPAISSVTVSRAQCPFIISRVSEDIRSTDTLTIATITFSLFKKTERRTCKTQYIRHKTDNFTSLIVSLVESVTSWIQGEFVWALPNGAESFEVLFAEIGRFSIDHKHCCAFLSALIAATDTAERSVRLSQFWIQRADSSFCSSFQF